MEKYFIFATGGGNSDPINWSRDEAVIYPVSRFNNMTPGSSNTLIMNFEGGAKVILKIRNGYHVVVMEAISTAITKSKSSYICVADVDRNKFLNKNIYGVNIKSQETFTQTLTGSTKTKINTTNSNYSSCLIANTHSDSAVTVKLVLISQVGTDITDTGTNLNNGSGYAVTESSQAVTVDGTAATADVFDGERVYKSDGSLFGVCTARNSNTQITFGNGLEQAFVDDDDLYTGTRYTLLNAISIPANVVLKLESNEISFDDTKYSLYAYSGDGSGYLTFTFNYS